MTLTERIASLRKDRDAVEEVIKDQREKLWDAHYVTKHDARRKGESDEHWHARRKRNRERFERRDKVVENLAKRKKAIQHEIDVLVKHKEDQHDHGVPNPDPDGDNWASFDGKMVASWMVGENPDKQNYLADARATGLWHGSIISGGRTPAYSTWLCMQICGRPTCSGTCAGASSNHASNDGFPLPINGAVDVSDPDGFEDAMAEIGCPYFRNDLPLDPNHHSPSGH